MTTPKKCLHCDTKILVVETVDGDHVALNYLTIDKYMIEYQHILAQDQQIVGEKGVAHIHKVYELHICP